MAEKKAEKAGARGEKAGGEAAALTKIALGGRAAPS